MKYAITVMPPKIATNMAARGKQVEAVFFLARTARFSDMDDPNYLRNGELFFYFDKRLSLPS